MRKGRIRFSEKRRREEADNEMIESRGRKVTERQKDVRMRFTVQLLFNLLRKAKLFSRGELYPVL